MKKSMRHWVSRALFISAVLWGVACRPAEVRAQDTTPAATSQLAGIALPPGTVRIVESSIPKEISNALETMIKAGGDKVKRGRTEILAWTGNGYKLSRVPQLKAQIGTKLKSSGWDYTEGEKIEGADGFTMLSAVRTTPQRVALLGFWAPTKEALIMGWTEMLPARTDDAPTPAEAAPAEATPAEPTGAPDKDTPTKADDVVTDDTANTPAATAPAGATVIELSDSQAVVNAMKTAMPKLPTFPALAPKPGMVRGYVKDADGKPLTGAVIGVRSTAVGGVETSSSSKTDAKGYYEILVPWGAAGFYNAGYTVDYGEGRAALGLYPADGEADEFASPKGHVENWVLLSYGIADRDGASEQPQYLNNYFGGAVDFEFHDENSGYGDGLPFGSVVEITLTPEGTLLDGSKGHAFVIHKKITESGQHFVHINNLPIGTYHIAAAVQGGKALRLKEVGPEASSNFGLDPKEATGGSTLLFRPYGAKADMVTAAHGHWKGVEIIVAR